MSIPLRVADVLSQGDSALRALSPSLVQRVFQLDWSGVPRIAPAHLDALFSAIPEAWGFVELGDVMDVATLSDALAEQLLAWVEGRGEAAGGRQQAAGAETRSHESTIRSPSPASRLLPPASCLPARIHPILALEQVTDEYRSYLQSEFRAKDPTLKAALDAALDEPRFLA